MSVIHQAGPVDQAQRRLAAAMATKEAISREGEVVLLNGADVKPEPVCWLWQGWLALGKLHILAGAPGQGKTTIALAVAAAVTRGGRLPDGSACEPGNVLIWSGEDDPADTLLPRLMAMNADLRRVCFVQGARIDGQIVPFDPARDIVQLADAAGRIGGAKLLILDPVVSAVTGDSHKNTEVRRALQPVVELASALGAAVLGISHFGKGSAGRDPTERVVGSVAFGAVARVVLVAAKVKGPDGEERRIIARSKSNIGPDDGGFVYSLDQVEAAPGIQASRLLWGEAVQGSARDLIAEPEDQGDELVDVDGFLRNVLADGVPTPSKAVQKDAREAGFNIRTVQRAAKRIGVVIAKGGMKDGWYWTLPKATRSPEDDKDVTFRNVSSSASSVASSGGLSLDLPADQDVEPGVEGL